MSVNLDAMKADTGDILADWGESLTVKRATVSYSGSGTPTESWATQGTFTGEWQPTSGKTERNEAGRQIKSDAQVMCAVDEDVEIADRIYRADDTYMIINYIKFYEDHWTIYLTRTEGSE